MMLGSLLSIGGWGCLNCLPLLPVSGASSSLPCASQGRAGLATTGHTPASHVGEGSWSREGGPSSNTREAALEEPSIALPPPEKVPRKDIRRKEPAYGSIQLG